MSPAIALIPQNLMTCTILCCNLPVVVENHPSDGAVSRPSASFDTSVSVAVYVIEGLRSLSMALALKDTFVSPEVKN